MDNLNHENEVVARRFLERQREYQNNTGYHVGHHQSCPLNSRCSVSMPSTPISVSDEPEIIRRAQAERDRLEAEETSRRRDVVEVPSYDPDLTDAELRSLLAEAITEYDRCLLAVGTAEGNLARSQARMDEADKQLHSFAELDAEIASHRVAQIKQDRHDPLPAALQQAQVQRGALIDDIDAAHRAHQRLEAELADAKRELATATALRVHVAAFVVARHAEDLAHHLGRAMDVVEHLRRRLLSASAMWISTSTGATSLPLGPRARATVHRELQPAMSLPAYTAAFKSWHDRLLNDANAMLAES